MTKDIPKQHKAAQVKQAHGKLEVVTVQTVTPGPNQVLIKVSASGICASDHVAVDGLMPVTFPLTPGHEVVGTIVSVGSAIDSQKWPIGLKVGSGWNGGFCGTCEHCRKGHFQYCHDFSVTGVTLPGGHQEYVTLHYSALVRLPQDSSISDAEMAPLLCAGNTVFEALLKSGVQGGDVVVVQGLGGLGHLALQYAKKMGCTVVALSRTTEKKDWALKLGADHFLSEKDNLVEEMKKIGLAKVAIATAPSGSAPAQLLSTLDNFGKIMIVGLPADGQALQVNTMDLVIKSATIQGVICNIAYTNEKLTDWSSRNNVKAVVKTFPIEKTNEAYQEVMTGKPLFRNVIVM